MKTSHSLFLLSSVLFLAACAPEPKTQAPTPPAPAELSVVVVKDIRSYISTLGTTKAFQSVNVVPQVSGQIVQINFNQGDMVKAGDVLAVIDKTPFQAKVDAAKADLAKATAQAKIDTLELERNKKLVADGYIDKQTFDALVARVEVDNANIESAKAALSLAQINLDWCTIKAPIDGKVGLYKINLGNIVSANMSSITSIEQLDKLYIDFVIPSQRLNEVQEFMKSNGGKVDVNVSFIENDSRDKARMASASIVLNKMRYQTGSAILRGEIDNADFLFWPDQAVKIEVFLGYQKNATLVPEMSVQTGPLGPYVYIANHVEGGVFKLEQVQVETLQHYENSTLRHVTGIDGAEFVATRVSQLRLKGGPFVYKATSIGIPFDANGKLITDPNAIKEFIMSTIPINMRLVQEYRAAMMQQAQAAQAAPQADSKVDSAENKTASSAN